jgi:hypothetical protein
MQFKVFRVSDGRCQLFVCECGREHNVEGSIVSVFHTRHRDPLWLKLPLWKIKDSAALMDPQK